MWIYTTDGFYSVVHDRYCEPDELMIRARKREDLERLNAYNIKGDIIELPHADYRYRIPVKRAIWSKYLTQYAQNLRYNNFKNTLPPQDHSRHEAYYKCWEAMYTFQRS